MGYQFTNGWRIQLDALNLLNSLSYNASYAYGALLPSDALFAKCFPASGAPTVPAAVCQKGFMDYSIHPLDPTAVRLTLAGPIDTIDIPKMAAEFKRALPTYQPPAPNYEDGLLVGAYVDNTWSKTSASSVNNVSGGSSGFDTNSSRWGGGVQLGFDYMLPSRVVLGVAADISSGGTKTTTISDPSGISANQTTVFDRETIRGRFGYAAENVLFYATGGFAWSNAQFVRTQLTGVLNSATAGTDEAVNKGLMGRAGGGGIAYAFAQNWNVFAEYRYTSFGFRAFSLPFSQLTTTSTTTMSTVEFGVNYKFTSGGQVAGVPPAPYPGEAPSPALVYKSAAARYADDWSGLYLGGDGGFGWETAKGTLTDAAGAPLTPGQLPCERSARRALRWRQLPVEQNRARRGRRLAMVQPDRQQSDARAAWCRWHIPVRTLYGLDHGEGLRLRARPARFRVRSFPRIRYRRVGLGQSFDLLCACRRGSLRQSGRAFHRLDRRCRRRLRDQARALLLAWNTATRALLRRASSASRLIPPRRKIARRSAIYGPALHTNLAAVQTPSNFSRAHSVWLLCLLSVIIRHYALSASCLVCTRLCCKSRKLQAHEFFAKTRNGKRSSIRISVIALSKSPVSLT